MLKNNAFSKLPVVVCVAMYRTNGVLEKNCSMIGRNEGEDLWHFSQSQMVKQMMGHWKMMDEMKQSDQKGYDKYIKDMKAEWEGEKKKVDEAKAKQRIIESKPICSIKLRVAKIVVQNKKKDLSETIKLFDFDQNAEMNPTKIESEDE